MAVNNKLQDLRKPRPIEGIQEEEAEHADPLSAKNGSSRRPLRKAFTQRDRIGSADTDEIIERIRKEESDDSASDNRSEAPGVNDSNSDRLSDSEISEQQYVLRNNIKVAMDIPTSKSEAFQSNNLRATNKKFSAFDVQYDVQYERSQNHENVVNEEEEKVTTSGNQQN